MRTRSYVIFIILKIKIEKSTDGVENTFYFDKKYFVEFWYSLYVPMASALIQFDPQFALFVYKMQ
jgi:hypothetical protein